MSEEMPSPVHENLPMKFGTEFITAFYRLLKGATLYDRSSAAMDRLTQDCLRVINGIIEKEGNLLLKIVRDHFLFNSTPMIANADRYLVFRNLWRELRKRSIGGVEFSEAVTGEHLQELAYLLSGLEEKSENNYLLVEKQLEQRNIGAIEVGKLELSKDEDIDGDPEGQKKISKEVYFRCIRLVKEVVENIQQQRALPMRKARRLVQNAVNAILQDDSAALLGLANIKNYDEYGFNHSVNVAIYAMALGQRIGISKKHLFHLGMAGLFHDLGKTKIPGEILAKTGTLSPEESSILRSHPVIGTELILRANEWGELSARMIEGTFEHHLGYDLSGYPKLTQKKKTNLFGRIVAVADFYDALARPRAEHRFPYVSEKIVERMLERGGKDIDPAITKVFIHMIGVFPPGTLVLLNTNEMGVVTQAQEDTERIDRPKVCMIYYDDGEYRKERVVDLTEMDGGSGEFKRSIVKTLDPNEYNINVAEFFI
ncbi:MAG TPA: HD domain-containing phosphohydrolase [Thermodesulfobacteriota bacterium]|nr:HD domain-containing phosphohydrolase [Thermodesulfobacteriota bacterium]